MFSFSLTAFLSCSFPKFRALPSIPVPFRPPAWPPARRCRGPEGPPAPEGAPGGGRHPPPTPASAGLQLSSPVSPRPAEKGRNISGGMLSPVWGCLGVTSAWGGLLLREGGLVPTRGHSRSCPMWSNWDGQGMVEVADGNSVPPGRGDAPGAVRMVHSPCPGQVPTSHPPSPAQPLTSPPLHPYVAQLVSFGLVCSRDFGICRTSTFFFQ